MKIHLFSSFLKESNDKGHILPRPALGPKVKADFQPIRVVYLSGF